MNLVSFFEDVFLPNTYLYIISLFIVILIVRCLIKRFSRSVFDPLFYRLILMIFAYSIPLFLFFTKNMDVEHFLYFVSSETLFWVGFIIFSEKRINFSRSRFKGENIILSFLFYFSLISFISGTLYTYISLGIPLLLSNRNDVYKDSGGLGLLSHIIGFATNFILIYSVHNFLRFKRKKYLLSIILVVITTFLNGSKGGIMNICFTYFYYTYFYLKQNIEIKKEYYFYIVVFPILILFISSSSDILGAIYDLGVRFIASGDIFWTSYPDNAIDNIRIDKPLQHLFIGILGPLRIVPYDSIISEPVGLLMNWYVNPEYELLGMTTAPNSPTAIVTWVYYRWAGLILSFIIGSVASILIYKSSKLFPKSLLGIILYSSVYYAAVSFVTDPGMAISSFFSILFNFTIYGLIAFVATLQRQ